MTASERPGEVNELQKIVDLAIHYLLGVWNYRWVAVTVTWVICLGGWTYIYKLPNTYEAATTVYVNTKSVETDKISDFLFVTVWGCRGEVSGRAFHAGNVMIDTRVKNLEEPCIIHARHTEPPVTVDVGSNVLAGTDPQPVMRCIDDVIGGQITSGQVPEPLGRAGSATHPSGSPARASVNGPSRSRG